MAEEYKERVYEAPSLDRVTPMGYITILGKDLKEYNKDLGGCIHCPRPCVC
jgi:hypothetical protein